MNNLKLSDFVEEQQFGSNVCQAMRVNLSKALCERTLSKNATNHINQESQRVSELKRTYFILKESLITHGCSHGSYVKTKTGFKF